MATKQVTVIENEDLRYIRRYYGYTQKAFAHLVGVSQVYIFKIESNERPMTANVENRILAELGIERKNYPAFIERVREIIPF